MSGTMEERAGDFWKPGKAARRLRELKRMQEDNKPKLALVAENGEPVKEGKRSGRAPSGLTVKQESFAQGLAKGLSNADAYRQSHDAGGMQPATIHQTACRLAQQPKIAARVKQLMAENATRNSMFTEKQRERYSERVWRNLWAMIDAPDTPPAVKANLLSLGAKAAGMLTDKVEIDNKSVDSRSIEAELIERLQKLRA